VVRAFILPTLFKEIIELVPPFKLKNRFKLELDNLKVLRDYISLCGAVKFLNALCRGSPKLLAMLASFKVML
jgi:hypothetical protein